MAKNKIKTLRPSQSQIWTACPGSLKHLKEDSEGSEIFEDKTRARLGTLIHSLSEKYLKTADEQGFPASVKFDYSEYAYSLDVDDRILFESYLEDVENYIEFYYNCLRDDLKDCDYYAVEIHAAEKINKEYQLAGTADLIIIKNHTLTVIDLKTGLSPVSADKNKQLSLYSYLAKLNVANIPELEKIKKTELRIIQPSIGFISYGDPVEFSKENIKNSIKNLKDKPEYVTGPHCLYCPASDICKEYKKVIKRYLQPDIEDELTERPDLWAEILEMSTPVKKNIQRIEKLINEAAIKGGIKIPGYTNGVSYGRRAFIEKDPVKLSKKVGLKKSEVIDEKIKTPAQIEKLLKAKNKKQKLEGLTVTPSRVVLVPEVDLFSDESGDGGDTP